MTKGFTSNQIPACPGGTLYTIIPGDSYFGLARRFNITIAALIAANPRVEPTNLQLGQQICVPVPPTGEPCPGGFVYIIQTGDTFFSIANQFGTVVPALRAANPIVDPDRLLVGQPICVPARSPISCPGGRVYKIVAGDTLSNIARRFNSSVEALISANPGIIPASLSPGRLICIPR